MSVAVWSEKVRELVGPDDFELRMNVGGNRLGYMG